jgi:casein kinase II subunit alpha
MANPLLDRDKIVICQSPIYAYVNEIKGPQWYDHKTYRPTWVPPDGYEIITKVGRGKYSTVFKSAYRREKFVAIKLLVPIDPTRYLREIKILSNLKGGPHIVKLIDLVHDTVSDTFSFVFEWVEACDWRSTYAKLSLHFVRIIMYKLLKALLYAHSNGIMHRDIKPQNIAIDLSTLKVRLLDWGLADFYFPRQKYSCHVATRLFKPPELLIEYPYYDYSIDMWSLGLTFACMLFGRSPIQCGDSDEEQLECVAEFVGGKAIHEYATSLQVEIESSRATALLTRRGRGIAAYAEKYHRGKFPDEAIHLLERLLTVDHRKRITARDALKHPFFADLEAGSG